MSWPSRRAKAASTKWRPFRHDEPEPPWLRPCTRYCRAAIGHKRISCLTPSPNGGGRNPQTFRADVGFLGTTERGWDDDLVGIQLMFSLAAGERRSGKGAGQIEQRIVGRWCGGIGRGRPDPDFTGLHRYFQRRLQPGLGQPLLVTPNAMSKHCRGSLRHRSVLGVWCHGEFNVRRSPLSSSQCSRRVPARQAGGTGYPASASSGCLASHEGGPAGQQAVSPSATRPCFFSVIS